MNFPFGAEKQSLMSVFYFVSFFVKQLHHVWNDSLLSFDIYSYTDIDMISFIYRDMIYFCKDVYFPHVWIWTNIVYWLPPYARNSVTDIVPIRSAVLHFRWWPGSLWQSIFEE